MARDIAQHELEKELARHSPAPGPDLRHGPGRLEAGRILQLLDALPEADAALLRAYYADGRPAAELASLGALPDDPRQVRARIRRLTTRVLSPLFAFVVAHRRAWPPTRRRVASLCFIDGRSLRQVAAALRLSLHAVRAHRRAVVELYHAAHGAEVPR